MVRSKSSLALKGLQWLLTFVEFGCAAVILAIFSYFLATLHNHNLHIDTYIRAVEGISGVAVCFTFAGMVFLWCFAGISFFALIAILLDIGFTGAFVYVAYVTRGGAGSCKGYVNTPFGSGFANSNNKVSAPKGGITVLPSLKTACELEKATFAVAMIAIFFFLLSAFVELLLMKNHRKEKRFGPSPANNYTAGGSRRKFWQRKPKNIALEKNPNALPLHATPADVRESYATDATAVGAADPTYSKYGTGPINGTHLNNQSGLRDSYTAPTGTHTALNHQVDDGYAAPMGTHTAAGTGTTAYGAAPYPTEPAMATMPSVSHHHGAVNPAANY